LFSTVLQRLPGHFPMNAPTQFWKSSIMSHNSEPVVPELWRIEVANSLTLASAGKESRFLTALRLYSTWTSLAITVDRETGDHAWLETLALADKHSLTVYDATYLELALRRALPLPPSIPTCAQPRLPNQSTPGNVAPQIPPLNSIGRSPSFIPPKTSRRFADNYPHSAHNEFMAFRMANQPIDPPESLCRTAGSANPVVFLRLQITPLLCHAYAQPTGVTRGKQSFY